MTKKQHTSIHIYSTMKSTAVSLLFLSLFKIFTCQEPCTIEVDCPDCLPDHLPAVTSHVAKDRTILIPHGDQVVLHCHNTKFKRYPTLNNLAAICENNYFRISHDSSLAHLSDLGCQTNYIEDVSHHVDYCNNTYQGRSYQYHNAISSSVYHLAEICYDPDGGRTIFAHMTFSSNNNIVKNDHSDQLSRISLLQGFNQMFEGTNKHESEKVFADDVSMNKKMQYLIGKQRFNFADQSIVATKLIPASYYYDQNGIVTNFPYNKVAMWKSIASGNHLHIQSDIRNTFHRSNSSESVDIYTGTHGTLSLLVEQKLVDIFLKPGRKYPVPKYIYTLVHNKKQQKAVAIVLVNNPFISISEIRSAIFCPSSVCPHITWLQYLRLNNNYERTAYGLVFCCDAYSFSNIVVESPNILAYIQPGERGLLKHVPN